MGFQHRWRLSAHAVITNDRCEVLQLRQVYGDQRWGLPGGALEPGETIHDAIVRECREELGCDVEVGPLTGVYYHREFDSHAFIFRCYLVGGSEPVLSIEHSEYRYFPVEELSHVQRVRVEDALSFEGLVRSASF